MINNEEVDLSETNMALFGTDVEKNLKYKNAENEPEWKTIPKEPCTMIWRIEKFCVVPWPKEQYGSFYQGDSYIVLNIAKDGESLDYTAFMWVGKETTKDESGTAAYKIVELDDFFHGAVDLVYEAQGNESEDFLNLFKEIIIMEGGIASGFKKLEAKTYQPRLIKVIGTEKSAVKSIEVPMKFSSLTEEDGFIIDTGLELFSWRGEKAGGFKKYTTATICQKIKSSRNGEPTIKDFDEGDKGTLALMEKYLENDMQGEKPKVKLRSKKPKKVVKKMLKISDESGKIAMSEVPYSKDSLQTNDAFLIDNGKQIYIWVGSGASKNERHHGLKYAKEYSKEIKSNIDTTIILVKENSKKYNLEKIFI